MKKIVKDYFSFARKERNAAVILVICIGGFIALPYLYQPANNPPVVDEKLIEQLSKLKEATDSSSNNSYQPNSNGYAGSSFENVKVELFEFDPNTLDAGGWKRLGLRDKTINTLLNYRNKGGKFRKPEDINKIWGLRPDEAARIIPYARINSTQNTYGNFAEEKLTKAELFEFDPNTLDANGWKKLGLRDKTINTLLNYRSKGGKFRKPEDISKIWGLRPDEAARIIPYAKIASTQSEAPKALYANAAPVAKTLTSIDINTATAYDFKNLPGIENGLQYRIIKFREKLGGFISINQVRETYGLTDSAFQLMLPYLKYGNTKITKLNINTATEVDLDAHPYISAYTAKSIALYRTQHGNFASINDLRKISAIKEDMLQKMLPYLTTEQ